MPTYIFRNKKTDEMFEEIMGISEMEEFLEDNPRYCIVPAAVPCVGGIAGVTYKNDDGYKEMISKIAEANPYTPLGQKERRKNAKEVATENAVNKWRKKMQGDVRRR
jgi:hypothetical protein